MKPQGLIHAVHHWFSMNRAASWLALSIWAVIAPSDSLSADAFSCPMRPNSRRSSALGNGPAEAMRHVRCQMTWGTATQISHVFRALCHQGGKPTVEVRGNGERATALTYPFRFA